MIARLVAAAIGACLLVGCATDGTGSAVQIRTVMVDRPVPVSCVPKDSPEPPAYRDTDAALKAAPDFAVRDALIKGERPNHQAREAYLEALRVQCMKAGSTGAIPPQ